MSLTRNRWTFGLLPLLLAAASACGTSAGPANRNTASVSAGFMSSCTAGGASPGRCRCALDGIEDTFTLEQFTALEELSPSAQGVGLDALLARCSGD